MVDDDVLTRWMRLEMGRVNDSVAVEQLPLATAVRDAAASVPTRSGRPHRFDADALAAFAGPLPPLVRSQLRVPIYLYHGHAEPHDAFVRDAAAIDAILAHELVRTRPREGRLWLGLPLARELVARFPTVFQLVTV